jgi:hypothetical protein
LRLGLLRRGFEGADLIVDVPPLAGQREQLVDRVDRVRRAARRLEVVRIDLD